MHTMLKCPRCESDAKDTGKTWTYGAFRAELFYCPTCDRNFIAYYLEDKLSHTIPSGRDTGSRIINYLRTHDSARLDEIAVALNLDASDVLKVLMELEKKGKVERLTDK